MTLAETLERIGPADAAAMRRAEARHLTLTKPPGSLGRLEQVSIRLAGIFGTERPAIRGSAVIVAAGDHGVVAQGVTGYPQAVTAQMVRTFLAGGAAVSVMARLLGVRQIVADAGIAADALPDHPDLRSVRAGRGTGDISRGPAMSREQAQRGLEAGVGLSTEAADRGADLIATGDMGIGNTTAASAVTAAMTGTPPEHTTGAGHGPHAGGVAPQGGGGAPGAGVQRSRSRRPARRAGEAWAASRSACWPAWCWAPPAGAAPWCWTDSSPGRPPCSPAACARRRATT